MAMGDLTEEQVDVIVTQAEARAEEAEAAAAAARRAKRGVSPFPKEWSGLSVQLL